MGWLSSLWLLMLSPLLILLRLRLVRLMPLAAPAILVLALGSVLRPPMRAAASVAI